MSNERSCESQASPKSEMSNSMVSSFKHSTSPPGSRGLSDPGSRRTMLRPKHFRDGRSTTRGRVPMVCLNDADGWTRRSGVRTARASDRDTHFVTNERYL